MNLGAMIDLGVPLEHLAGEIGKLDIGTYEIKARRDRRGGIAGVRVDVHSPADGVSAGNRAPRTFRDIAGLIEGSPLSGKAKKTSLDIFRIIAEAEAKIHGRDTDDVHFHEIGAVDSIVDIVGAAVCLEYLKADRILSSPVQLGGGYVRCAHGILPVPAPATAEILKGVPIRSGLALHEMTTPTGAAVLAATVDRFAEGADFIPEKIGYGLGYRDAEVPNVLRVFLGRMDDAHFDEDIEMREACLVECNIDDMNPELYEPVLNALFEKGAYDAWLTPIIMKKSRPAVTIGILCGAEHLKEMEDTLWLQTTTLGLRTSRVTKKMLRRNVSARATKYGEVSVKNAYLRGRIIKSKPEYEDVKRLAKEKGVGVKEIYELLSEEL